MRQENRLREDAENVNTGLEMVLGKREGAFQKDEQDAYNVETRNARILRRP